MKLWLGNGFFCRLTAVALLIGVPPALAEFDHSLWDRLLERHVIVLEPGVTEVDYASLLADRAELQVYLQQLRAVSRVEFDNWPLPTQLAFLINAYNAWTVELILGRYPELDSIRDLGSLFRSPWKRRFIPLLGSQRSLDDIEHGLIRGSGRYAEPRIHFAVNCASVGCPALRPEAYVPQQLEAQLDTATRDFLADRQRNRWEGDELKISSIFRWYRDDFEFGWRSLASLEAFLSNYREVLGLDQTTAVRLAAGQVPIRFLDYDWRLNDRGSVP